MLRSAFTLALSLCVLAPAAAQQIESSRGSITGQLGIQEAQWVVEPDIPGIPQSGWKPAEKGLLLRLAAAPAQAPEPDGALIVEFYSSGSPEEMNARDPKVTFLPESKAQMRVAGPVSATLTLTAFQRVGNEITVTGNFAANLSEEVRESLVLDEDAIAVDGNFQATLLPLEQ